MVASNGSALRIDTCRSYGRVFGTPGVAYAHDGAWYDAQGNMVTAPRAEQPAATSPCAASIAEPARQSAPAPPDARRCSPAAERMRVTRLRRKDRLRVIPYEICDDEVEGLIKFDLLWPGDRNNRDAIARALGTLMNKIPIECWAEAMRK
jgi:hypothetical protein